jgi:hypothetical protein
MYCSRCGSENRPEKKFCTKCGARLGGADAGGRADDGLPPPSRTQPIPEPWAGGEHSDIRPAEASRGPVKALPVALTLVGAFILLIGFLQPWGVMRVTGLLGYYKETKLDWVSVLSIDNSLMVLFLLLICAVPLFLGLVGAGTGCGGAFSRYGLAGSALVGFQAASVVGLLAVVLIIAVMRGYAERYLLEAVRSSKDGWAVRDVVIEMGAAYKYLVGALIVSAAGAVANALPIINSGERRKIHNLLAASVAGAVVIGILTVASLCLIRGIAGMA